MKLPRDVDARQLIKALAKLGYAVTRQSGSHIRLTGSTPTPHSLTVPDHSPLKVGTRPQNVLTLTHGPTGGSGPSIVYAQKGHYYPQYGHGQEIDWSPVTRG